MINVSERDLRIDVVKGVCILLMVWGHLPMLGTCSAQLELIKGYIYTFHMPVFITLSGYLFGSKVGTRREVVKVCDRLLKPYLTMAIISLCMHWVADELGFNTSIHIDYRSIGAICDCIIGGRVGGGLWYLHTIGIAELLTISGLALATRMGGLAWFFVVMCVGGGAVALHSWGLGVVAEYIPYFLVGFFVRRSGSALPASKWAIFGVLIALLSFDIHRGAMGQYVWVFSVLSLLMLFAEMLNKKASSIGKFFAFCGRHSLAILLFHSIISVGVRPVLMQFIKLDSTGLVMFAANFTLAVGLSLLVECVWRRVPYVSKLIW